MEVTRQSPSLLTVGIRVHGVECVCEIVTHEVFRCRGWRGAGPLWGPVSGGRGGSGHDDGTPGLVAPAVAFASQPMADESYGNECERQQVIRNPRAGHRVEGPLHDRPLAVDRCTQRRWATVKHVCQPMRANLPMFVRVDISIRHRSAR